MGFILGVLILGALLSVIFGKAVGQLFVLGTGTVVMIFFGILLVLLSPLIWGFISTPSTPSRSYSYSSTPAYGSSAPSQTYAPNTQTPAPAYQAAAPVANDQTAAPAVSEQMPASTRVPRLGLDVAGIPLGTQSQLAQPDVPSDTGVTVTGGYGNPATSPSLQTSDIILKAGIQDQNTQLIDSSHPLPDFLARVPYNVPVLLYVYRPGQNEFWVKLHPQ